MDTYLQVRDPAGKGNGSFKVQAPGHDRGMGHYPFLIGFKDPVGNPRGKTKIISGYPKPAFGGKIHFFPNRMLNQSLLER
jgi:hypothetical protein